MNTLPQLTSFNQDFTFDDIVRIADGQPMTTSMKVAEVFGKRHTHVLDKIKNLDCSPEFSSANFSAHVQLVEIGHPKLREHLASIITLLKLSKNKEEFMEKVDLIHPAFGKTLSLEF